jgi:hypothetical protein
MVDQHNNIALFVAFSGILATLVFRFSIYYTRTSVEMDEMIWDTKTMTSSDFSVKIFINERVLMKWNEQNEG